MPTPTRYRLATGQLSSLQFVEHTTLIFAGRRQNLFRLTFLAGPLGCLDRTSNPVLAAAGENHDARRHWRSRQSRELTPQPVPFLMVFMDVSPLPLLITIVRVSM